MRKTLFNVFIIKSGNALAIFLLPIIMLFQWRFHPVISNYIPRFFFVLSKLTKLLICFIIICFALDFSFSTVQDLKYGVPIDLSLSKEFNIGADIKTYVIWMASINNIFRGSLSSLIVMMVILIVLFTGIAMTQENVRAG